MSEAMHTVKSGLNCSRVEIMCRIVRGQTDSFWDGCIWSGLSDCGNMPLLEKASKEEHCESGRSSGDRSPKMTAAEGATVAATTTSTSSAPAPHNPSTKPAVTCPLFLPIFIFGLGEEQVCG